MRLTKKERALLKRLHDHTRVLVAHLPMIAPWFEDALQLLLNVATHDPRGEK